MSIHAQSNGCTCEWDGDDHYGTIIKRDEWCPYHKWSERKDTPYIKKERPCPHCNGTGKMVY